MSNDVKTKEKLDMDPKYLVRLTLVLLAFSAVVALLLGLVNGVTVDKIAAINAEKTGMAMAAVVEDPECEFSPLDLTQEAMDGAAAFNGSTLVEMSAVISGGETVGPVCQIITGGSQGDITMVVGLDLNGVVTGSSIVKMVETSGLGTKANEDAWRAQYIGTEKQGADGFFLVDKDGGNIQAISGATVSSRAVTNGVNAAIAAAKTLG